MRGNKPFALVLHYTQNTIIESVSHSMHWQNQNSVSFLSFVNRQMLQGLNLIFCNHSTLKTDK